MSYFKRLLYEGGLFDILGELNDNLPGEESDLFSGEISYKYVPYKFQISKEVLLATGKSKHLLNEETLPFTVVLSLNDGLLDGNCLIYYNNKQLISGNWALGKREGNLYYFYDNLSYFSGMYINGSLNGLSMMVDSKGANSSINFKNGVVDEEVTVTESLYSITTYYNDEMLIWKRDIEYLPHTSKWCIKYSSVGLPMSLEKELASGNKYLIKRFYVQDKSNIMIVTDNNILVYQGEYAFFPPFWFVFNGKGVLYSNHRVMYRGSFKYGIRQGEGDFYYANGALKYHGNWENDLPEGEGDLYRSNGTFWGKIKCSAGIFNAGLKTRSIFTFVPSTSFTEFFNNQTDPQAFSNAKSWTFDPQFTSFASLNSLIGEGESSPILRFNKDRYELLSNYRTWMNLNESTVITSLQTLSLENCDTAVDIDFSIFISLTNLNFGDSTFTHHSYLKLSDMFFLKNVVIGDFCFNGIKPGCLSFQNLPNLQTVSVGASFANASSFIIDS